MYTFFKTLYTLLKFLLNRKYTREATKLLNSGFGKKMTLKTKI